MIPNLNKILKEWSYRVGVIKPRDEKHIYHLNKILTEEGWSYAVIDEIIDNMKGGRLILNEEPFSYTILSNRGKGKPKPYQTMWLDTIENGEEFELEPNGTAIIDKKILTSKGNNPDGLTFKELLSGKGTKQDWNDWFKTNTNKIIPTNQGLLSLIQISKSTFTGRKGDAGGVKKPSDAAFYEKGICMAHAIINKGMSRQAAFKATGVSPGTYVKYQTEVEDNVGNKIVSNSKIKSLPLIIHTGQGLSDSVVKPYANNTPKTDIMAGKSNRLSVKKAGGSQLMSGLRGDTLGVFEGAKQFWASNGKVDPILQQCINAISDKATGFTDEAIKGDQEVGQIKKNFQTYYISARYNDIKKEASKELQKELKKKDPDGDLVKRLTGKKTGKTVSDDAIKFHAKAEAQSLGLLGGGNKPHWFLPGVTQISPTKTSKLFKDFLKTYNNTDAKTEAKAILLKSIDHKNLDTLFDSIWTNKEFKKWAVYEAATGNYKFSGDTTIGSTQSSIANKILKFDTKGGTPLLMDITEAWAGTESGKVTSNVGYKSGGRSKSSSWRLQISEDILNEYSLPEGTIYQYEMNKMIDEEFSLLVGGVKLLVENYEDTIDLLLTEGFFSDLKSKALGVIKKLNGIAKKLLDGIKSMIAKFYNNIIKKLISKLKEFASKGFEFFVDALGIEITGTCKVDVSF